MFRKLRDIHNVQLIYQLQTKIKKLFYLIPPAVSVYAWYHNYKLDRKDS
jgi:hypothetical protein